MAEPVVTLSLRLLCPRCIGGRILGDSCLSCGHQIHVGTVDPEEAYLETTVKPGMQRRRGANRGGMRL